MAIAHDDDLQLIEDMVCSSHNADIYTRSNLLVFLPRMP